MTVKAPRTPLTQLGGEDELRHYTPEEVYEKGLLPIKPRTLRDKAQRYEIPHSRSGGPRGKITFLLRHIREINESLEVRPLSETKPATAPAAA